MNKEIQLQAFDDLLSISMAPFTEEQKQTFLKRVNDHFQEYSMEELCSFAQKYEFNNTDSIEEMLRLYDLTLKEVLCHLKNKLS